MDDFGCLVVWFGDLIAGFPIWLAWVIVCGLFEFVRVYFVWLFVFAWCGVLFIFIVFRFVILFVWDLVWLFIVLGVVLGFVGGFRLRFCCLCVVIVLWLSLRSMFVSLIVGLFILFSCIGLLVSLLLCLGFVDFVVCCLGFGVCGYLINWLFGLLIGFDVD